MYQQVHMSEEVKKKAQEPLEVELQKVVSGLR